jgi:hypothetical protein
VEKLLQTVFSLRYWRGSVKQFCVMWVHSKLRTGDPEGQVPLTVPKAAAGP